MQTYQLLHSRKFGSEEKYGVCIKGQPETVEYLGYDELSILVMFGLEVDDSVFMPVWFDTNDLNLHYDESLPVYEDSQEETSNSETPIDNSESDATETANLESEEEGNVVSRLYKLLTPEQVVELKRYYLWYSQRLFENEMSNTSLKIKPKKKQKLDNLRGDGDWRYAGFLDVGSKEAGYTCTLGHKLRFMHLAWDITQGDIEQSFFGEDYSVDYEQVIKSNNCIAFGINCIGDFFEVPASCLASLKRAQRDSLADMELLYDLYTNETLNLEEIQDSFKFLDDVIGNVGTRDLVFALSGAAGLKPVLPKSCYNFYKRMRDVGLIPPKSLVQLIRSVLVGWTDGTRYFNNKWSATQGGLKAPNLPVFYENIPIMLRLGPDMSEHLKYLPQDIYRKYLMYSDSLVKDIWLYLYLAFTYKLCGYYAYNATKGENSDEGGYSRKVHQDLWSCYRHSHYNVYKDFGFNVQSVKQILPLLPLAAKLDSIADKQASKYIINIEDNCATYTIFYINTFYTTCVEKYLQDYEVESGEHILDVVKATALIYQSLHNGMPKDKPIAFGNYTFNSGEVELDKVISELQRLLPELDAAYQKLLDWQNAKEQAKLKQQQDKLKQEEEQLLASVNPDLINSADELISYLKTLNLDTVAKVHTNSDDITVCIAIAKKVLSGSKVPSPKQLYRLSELYTIITGKACNFDGAYGVKATAPTKEQLTLEQENAIMKVKNDDLLIQQVIAKIQASNSRIDVDKEKVLGIYENVIKTGTFTERQKKYITATEEVAK